MVGAIAVVFMLWGLLALAIFQCAWDQDPEHLARTGLQLRPGWWQMSGIFAGLLVPTFGGAGLSPQSYRWGVDWVEQARQRLRAVLLVAALPTCAFGVVLTTCVGWTETHVRLMAITSTSFLLRTAWRGFAPQGEFAGIESLVAKVACGAIVPVLVVAILLPISWSAIGVAACVGIVGLTRRFARWREPALALSFAESDER
ncbi:MAG: hypothetical protein JNK15_25560 [Planctomycetes bacterium]|nr:hypothetical protein [Planctomycetota bacterium]